MITRTTLRMAALAAPLALGACASVGGNAPLVSGMSPASGSSSLNAEPQSANSLPKGAEGLQSSGPNNTAPNYLGATFKAF